MVSTPPDRGGSREPTSIELLDLDIDVRLRAETWQDMWRATSKRQLPRLAALLRSAYGRGYLDALAEPERGQLCRDHGIAIPKRDSS
jgi:hypothetical protein